MWVGGVRPTMQMAQLCRKHGLKFTPHSWSNGLGFIVNAHIMAASGFAQDLPQYCSLKLVRPEPVEG